MHPPQSRRASHHLRCKEGCESDVHVFDRAQRLRLIARTDKDDLGKSLLQRRRLGVRNAPGLHRPRYEKQFFQRPKVTVYKGGTTSAYSMLFFSHLTAENPPIMFA